MRAMTFERLVRDRRFASEVATTAVGRLGLARPSAVITVNADVSNTKTAQLLDEAHIRASGENAVTLIHALALPFPGFEGADASEVKPDFAIVAPQPGSDRSWLIMGDAKDYERVRSKIEDSRLLKGFLQVALGAEAAAQWSRLPTDMAVHTHGVLAVPRNAFLQPEAVVELLEDHREEVRMRVAERIAESSRSAYKKATDVSDYVEHLRAKFDPSTCTTCTLFAYCRHELRTSSNRSDLLVELGIPKDHHALLVPLLGNSEAQTTAPASVHANVKATITGRAEVTGQRRTDPIGLPGNVYVAIAKSDSAALGVYGVSIARQTSEASTAWSKTVFDDPQSPETRRRLMRTIGRQIDLAMATQQKENPNAPSPIHLVVPDQLTADVLVSIADNLAGVELSRLRWTRDVEAGREPLTFNGEPAVIPAALTDDERIAVSFLLEEDRSRAVTLRSPVVDLRSVLAGHVVTGGPAVASLRLDYLLSWAETLIDGTVYSRDVEDKIEASAHTPGARLTSGQSDTIHAAQTGFGRQSSRERARKNLQSYRRLVGQELDYKQDVFDRTFTVLDEFDDSSLLETYRAIEGDAQAVWRRRLELRASDLVRFGRTYRHWRNSLVPVIESDGICRAQLLSLSNKQFARDLARDPGNRQVAFARVVGIHPLTLEIASRRIGDGARIVLLHNGDHACVEQRGVSVDHQKGSFKIGGLAIGPIAETPAASRFTWTPANSPSVDIDDELVVADFSWFCDNKRNTHLNITRPTPDTNMAPTPACTNSSYSESPQVHQWCCKPHDINEAEWSDKLARRRANGELNPETWPPVIDGDAFEVSPRRATTGDAVQSSVSAVPDTLTIDDLD